MIQSISANNLTTNSSAVLSSAKVTIKADDTQTAAQAVSTDDANISKDGDTVSISAQGTALAKQNHVGYSENTTANGGSVTGEDEGYTDATASALSNAAGDIGITEASQTKSENSAAASAVSSGTSSSSSSSSTSDLSSYSLSELQEMLRNGEITQAEYKEELASRNGTSDTESDTEASDASETEA